MHSIDGMQLVSRGEDSVQIVGNPSAPTLRTSCLSGTAIAVLVVAQAGDRRRSYFSPDKEGQIVRKVTSTLIAAAAALTVSGVACAQSNNTLATPSVVSPAAAPANATTSGYGTPGATSTDSGTAGGSQNPGMLKSADTSGATTAGSSYGGNNTLATPSVKSPSGQ
jgi:hypothetical protein